MQTTTVDMRSTAHACAVPDSDEQLWEITAAFLAAGLTAGEQVLYFDDGTVDAVLERLVDDRVPVRGPLANGQLSVVDAAETRRVLRGPVRDAAVGLAVRIDQAVADGYPGFRVTGQLNHGLGRPDGVELGDYDTAFDSVIAGRPARVLCLYDRHRFPDDAITRLRALHRFELDTRALYDDNLLRVTRLAPFRVRLAGEVDQSNRSVLHRLMTSTLDDALRSHVAPSVLEFDLSSLRFLDVAGAVAFVHAAEGFPESHRLALRGVRPAVLRVLDRCGAPFAAQLDVSAHPGHDLGVPPVTGREVAGREVAGREVAGREVAGREVVGPENAGGEIAGQEVVGQEVVGPGMFAHGTARPAVIGHGARERAAPEHGGTGNPS